MREGNIDRLVNTPVSYKKEGLFIEDQCPVET